MVIRPPRRPPRRRLGKKLRAIHRYPAPQAPTAPSHIALKLRRKSFRSSGGYRFESSSISDQSSAKSKTSRSAVPRSALSRNSPIWKTRRSPSFRRAMRRPRRFAPHPRDRGEHQCVPARRRHDGRIPAEVEGADSSSELKHTEISDTQAIIAIWL